MAKVSLQLQCTLNVPYIYFVDRPQTGLAFYGVLLSKVWSRTLLVGPLDEIETVHQTFPVLQKRKKYNRKMKKDSKHKQQQQSTK